MVRCLEIVGLRGGARDETVVRSNRHSGVRGGVGRGSVRRRMWVEGRVTDGIVSSVVGFVYCEVKRQWG